MAYKIQKAVSGAEVSGERGRAGAFEITVDNKLLFSKRKRGGYPHTKQVIIAIQDYKGGDIQELTDTKSECAIL